MNDKEQIELVRIAGRLTTVEQDVAELKSDMSVVKSDVSDMKRDITYMKGKIDVIVDLLGSVIHHIKIPE